MVGPDDMNILFINTNDKTGGAARAQYRIFNGLKNQGINVEMYVLSKKSNTVNIQNLSKYSKFKRILVNRLINILINIFYKKKSIFSLNLTPSRDLIKKINAHKADIVHLNWINAEFLSIKDISKIKKPIIWTLHDMWAFTGGCHYSAECVNYKNHCHKCPILSSSHTKDISYYLFEQKINKFKNIECVITPSKWLANEAKSSKIFNNTLVKVIGNGIDELFYNKRDQLESRKKLNINSIKKTILFGAMGAKSDYRKGYDLLINALNYVKCDCDIIIFGTEHIKTYEDEKGRKIYELGKIDSENKLISIYNSADVMVVPSRQDNLPNIVLEAMMCQLPVVGFEIGGLTDMIIHKINGYLAKPYAASDLASGIDWTIKNNSKRVLSRKSREWVVQNYNIRKIVLEHIKLYEGVINDHTSSQESF